MLNKQGIALQNIYKFHNIKNYFIINLQPL